MTKGELQIMMKYYKVEIESSVREKHAKFMDKINNVAHNGYHTSIESITDWLHNIREQR